MKSIERGMRPDAGRVAALALGALGFLAACGGDDGQPTEPDPTDRQVASVTVTPGSVELAAIDATRTLAASAEDSDGAVVPGVDFTWSSSEESVATVDGDGTVTARANGAATIRAEASGVAGTARVIVRAGALVWAGVSGGPFNTCGVTTHGTVYCWGSNRHEQLGVGGGSRSIPVEIESDRYFSGVASSGQACAVTTRGLALCWGSNAIGEMGDGTGEPSRSPVPVDSNERFRTVTTAGNHTCGLTVDGLARCWGINAQGELGDGTNQNRLSPVPVEGDRVFERIAAAPSPGSNHTCALTPGGEAWCWGPNDDGELGDGTTTDRTAPVRVQTDLVLARVSPGSRHTCALSEDGAAWCWGANDTGQLGDGTTTPRLEPVRVEGHPVFREIAVGGFHACALDEDGAAWCWGLDTKGQLGDGGGLDSRPLPGEVSGGHAFERIHAGSSHTCAVTPEGASWCWGDNSDGQLADGTFVNRSVPVRVPAPGEGG